MLTRVRRSYADMTLEDMTPQTDAGRLFSTPESVPGMFTRQAWEGGVQEAIDNAVASRRDEIDWVLSDSRKTLSGDVSPEALKQRLTARYFTDFAGAWLNFLNSIRLNPAHNIADVTDQLTLVRGRAPVAADCPDEHPGLPGADRAAERGHFRIAGEIGEKPAGR